jgi:hypothetical protein
VYAGVLRGYQHLVAQWFAPFAPRLRTAVLLPARLVGVVRPPTRDGTGKDMPPGIAWYLEPLPVGKQPMWNSRLGNTLGSPGRRCSKRRIGFAACGPKPARGLAARGEQAAFIWKSLTPPPRLLTTGFVTISARSAGFHKVKIAERRSKPSAALQQHLLLGPARYTRRRRSPSSSPLRSPVPAWGGNDPGRRGGRRPVRARTGGRPWPPRGPGWPPPTAR